MKDFRYLSYNTEYSSTGAVEKEMGHAACFSTVFNRIPNGNSSVEYDIHVYKIQKEGKSNFCLLSLEEMKTHLKKLKTFGAITFEIKDEVDFYTVHLSVKDAPGIVHKYALTWTRYLYEYPYNVSLFDAYKLKQDPIFNFTSIADLFNVILGSNPEYPGGLHQIPGSRTVKLKSISQIKDRLKNIRRLNDLYEDLDRIDIDTIPEEYGKYSTIDVEYWRDNKNFEESRKPIYIKNFKTIKEQ